MGAGQEAPPLPLLSHLLHVHPQLSASSVARTVDLRRVVGVIDVLSQETRPCKNQLDLEINQCIQKIHDSTQRRRTRKEKVLWALPQSAWNSQVLPPPAAHDPSHAPGAGLCSAPCCQRALAAPWVSTKPPAWPPGPQGGRPLTGSQGGRSSKQNDRQISRTFQNTL